MPQRPRQILVDEQAWADVVTEIPANSISRFLLAAVMPPLKWAPFVNLQVLEMAVGLRLPWVGTVK